jgi:predicted small metal-binding protein
MKGRGSSVLLPFDSCFQNRFAQLCYPADSRSRFFHQQLSILPHSALNSLHNSSGGKRMATITKPDRTNQGNENYSFRCADAGFTGCSWEARGSSPDDVLQKAEQHGREQHNLTSINDQTRDMVRSKIRQAA